jgi:hypothetical protein
VKVVCAWCGNVLSGPEDGGPVSHGICGSCAVSIRFRREPLDEFLDRLARPVRAVDAEVHVLGANANALALVQGDLSTVVGRRTGNVLSCVHASQPGGCGQTVHCS